MKGTIAMAIMACGCVKEIEVHVGEMGQEVGVKFRGRRKMPHEGSSSNS